MEETQNIYFFYFLVGIHEKETQFLTGYRRVTFIAHFSVVSICPKHLGSEEVKFNDGTYTRRDLTAVFGYSC